MVRSRTQRCCSWSCAQSLRQNEARQARGGQRVKPAVGRRQRGNEVGEGALGGRFEDRWTPARGDGSRRAELGEVPHREVEHFSAARSLGERRGLSTPVAAGERGDVVARCAFRALFDAVQHLPGHDEVGRDDDGEVERLDPARFEA